VRPAPPERSFVPFCCLSPEPTIAAAKHPGQKLFLQLGLKIGAKPLFDKRWPDLYSSNSITLLLMVKHAE
jgi:hypothetical protein